MNITWLILPSSYILQVQVPTKCCQTYRFFFPSIEQNVFLLSYYFIKLWCFLMIFFWGGWEAGLIICSKKNTFFFFQIWIPTLTALYYTHLWDTFEGFFCKYIKCDKIFSHFHILPAFIIVWDTYLGCYCWSYINFL